MAGQCARLERTNRKQNIQRAEYSPFVGYAGAGLTRRHMPPDALRYLLNAGWAEHQIRHWHSLRNIKRDEDGKIIRST
eukprot:4300910-Pyramimonas_sp.AAC.1